LTWFINSIACYLGMCVLICVILLVCANAIAFLNFRPKCGAIIQPKSSQTKLWPEKCMAQYRWNLVENVTFETRCVSLVYRHAHYRSCLARKCHVWDTPCIAGVSSRSLSLMSRSKMSRLRHAVYRLCIVTLIIAQCLARKCHVWDTPCVAVTPWFLVRVTKISGPLWALRAPGILPPLPPTPTHSLSPALSTREHWCSMG
jgi:hypothetical protein